MVFAQRRIGSLTLLTPEEGVVFTCRSGGVSEGAFRSLNLSHQVGDLVTSVEENRRRVLQATGLTGWASARQVHGDSVVSALECSGEVEADAIVLKPGEGAAAVLTADCLPIALRSDAMSAAVHAGWRGLVAGVIERTLEKFPEASEARAWIGPSIGPCHYEVGAEVAEQISAAARGTEVVIERGGSLWADLVSAATSILESFGVTVQEREPPCTHCDHRFFSHRRDGVTGRQALLVWM